MHRTRWFDRLGTQMRLIDLTYFIAEHDDHHLGGLRELTLDGKGNAEPEEDRVDRSYKQDIPSVIKRLEHMRDQFAAIDSKTDWTRLRIEPLLEHAKSLDRLIHAKQFARETTRLRRGVAMFHADLVYFRDNIRGLNKVLESEKKGAARP